MQFLLRRSKHLIKWFRERERVRIRRRRRRRRIVAVAWCCLERGRGGNDKGYTLLNRLMVQFNEEN
jgi:hypothetical protein